MKSAIIVLSDPKQGSEEALGRLFNALATAYDYKSAGDEVKVFFQGTGVRWVGELVKFDHPAHELYEAVKDKIQGVSCGCSDVFGGIEEVEKKGFSLIKDNKVPGTSGLPSLRQLSKDGYSVLSF